MYYISFNEYTSKAYKDNMNDNIKFLKCVENSLTQYLRSRGSITLRYILDKLYIDEDCPNTTYPKTSKDCYVDLGIDDKINDISIFEDADDIILCIEVNT